MLTDNNKKATILAYYFSKFDRDAMRELGYDSLTDAFTDISIRFGKDNNYLKLRRDEFDPLTGSHRVGFNKREPNQIVKTFHEGLRNYNFEDLTSIVKTLLDDTKEFNIPQIEKDKAKTIITKYSEEELELLINGKDTSSTILRQEKIVNTRIFDSRIPNSLKALYNFRCQICGACAVEAYGVDISEAHHIHLFSQTANNDVNNIMILCLDHHRIIHKANPIFDYNLKQFEYKNGKIDKLMYNIHL